MKITVLWEDRRGAASKGFGPHELLLTCVADDLGIAREALKERILSHPRKGNTNVRKALRNELPRYTNHGPVIAVVDSDQLHDLWPPKPPPPTCTSGLVARFRQDAAGDYDLVLLVRNMETLIQSVCEATRQRVPEGKPKPDERDGLLSRATWGTADVRHALRDGCPSFDRLVTRVARHLRSKRERIG